MSGFSVATFRRGVHLGWIYVILGLFVGITGIASTNAASLGIPTHGVPNGLNLKDYLPLLFVPLLALASLMSSIPVVLLFAHDRANGLLEYLLSVGMNQQDTFRAYAASSILMALIVLFPMAVIETLVTVSLGLSAPLIASVVAVGSFTGIAVVLMVNILMTAFTSLQNQPAGFNQPLGVAVGVIPLTLDLVFPLAVPGLAFVVVSAVALSLTIISIVLLVLSGRLIRRESLLP